MVDLTPSEERSKTNNKVEGEIINVVRDEKEWRKMPYWYEPLEHIFGLHCISMRWSSAESLSTCRRRSFLTSVLISRPREFPKNTYPDSEDDSRGLPPTDSEGED